MAQSSFPFLRFVSLWSLVVTVASAYKLPARHHHPGVAHPVDPESPFESAKGIMPPPTDRHRRDDFLEAVAQDGENLARPNEYVESPEERELRRDGRVNFQPVEDYHAALLQATGHEHHASQLLMYYRNDDPINWSLFCTWFSGTEGKGTVAIMMSRLERGSDQWSEPVVVREKAGYSLQNPVWLWDKTSGAVHLIHTAQPGKSQSRAILQAVTSYDEGRSWSAPRTLIQKLGTFVRNPPVLSSDGLTWMLPIYFTPQGAGHLESQWSQIAYSQDGGQSWMLIKGIDNFGKMSDKGSGLVQPSVVRTVNETHPGQLGPLTAFFRDRNKEHIWRADSSNEGLKWSKRVPTMLPNANKAVQALTLEATTSNTVVVFNNNRGFQERAPCPDAPKRLCVDMKMHPLSVALSRDDGITFPWVRDLEIEFDRFLEYTYPSVVQTPDGNIHITYTWSSSRRRVAIRYVRITEEWVKRSYEGVPWGNTNGVYKPFAMPAWLMNG